MNGVRIMPDREKVIQGLLHHKGNKTPSPCDGCPYDDEEPHCSQRLAEDALVLLREQKERIKRLIEDAKILCDALDEKEDDDA